uniref:Beta-2-microglobulin n=1 Tax=Epinephelus coioides TaxID=94232 RepID=F2VYS8_EPICO|nr:beta2-microglobulin [Epinephelus coioides]ADZ99099.1 beta2-microglobulin [Epinephelus coioides]ADZ99100.1 beta2-microglobulin [Epinephelus coioides]ADZ99103.1 beta2-microglobulin [Epinephelus coioides]
MDKILVMCLAALVALSCAEETKHSSPKVQVYSFQPGQYGKDNTLICHVSKFHPPDITIQLMKNGQELPNAEQTDLAFENDWHFHLTKHVAFKPMEGDKYSCKVTHGKTVKDFAWESNM